MPTRNVSLTDHWVEFVDGLVDSGEFNNASEVHREALRRLERERERYAIKLEALRAALAVGDAAIADGRYTVLTTPAEISDHVADIGRRARARAEA
jgi:antitoxin ParD1/3/4